MGGSKLKMDGGCILVIFRDYFERRCVGVIFLVGRFMIGVFDYLFSMEKMWRKVKLLVSDEWLRFGRKKDRKIKDKWVWGIDI